MSARFGWLTLLSRCTVVAVSAAILATATSQAYGTVTTAHGHGLHRSAPHTRCAVRNQARGSMRLRGGPGLGLFDTRSLNPYQDLAPGGLFVPFFVFDNKLRMIPVTVTEIPTLKNRGLRNGGKTVILHLKKGQRWSNGAEFTSADAQFGWRVATDKATGPLCTGPCAEIKSVQTPDRYTVAYRLTHVTPDFLTEGLPSSWPTTWPGAWKDDPHAAAIKLGTDPTFNFKGPNYPTNGPYQVEKVVEGKEVILRPMKYFTSMNCGGFISAIHVGVNQSQATGIAEAAAGRVDLLDGGNILVTLLPELKRHHAYTIHLDPAFTHEHLEFNVDSTVSGAANPLHDARVRLALALALDKRQLIRTVLPLSARQARGLLAWTPWINTPKLVQPFADTTIRGQWDPISESYVSDTGHGRALADARTLLASTRWKHGFTIDLQTTDTQRRRATVPVLTAAWAKIGVTVKATFSEFKNGVVPLFDSWDNGGGLAHGAFQVALLAEVSGVSPDGLASSFVSKYIDRRHSDHSLPAGNNSGIDDSVIDKSFESAGRTVDGKIRRVAFARIQREINQFAYWVPLYFIPSVWTTNGHIQNLSYSPTDGVEWNMWDWKVRGR